MRAQAPTQQESLPAAYAADAGKLPDKFTGLANAIAGKYDWRPSAGVRSVGEVLDLIVMENGMLAGIVSGTQAPRGPRPAPITDPAQLQEALKTSYHR